MVKGVKTKTKQPILFTFCKSATKKYELKKIIKETIVELQKAGIIIIVATICDQAATNVAAIKLLIEETKEEYLRKNKEFKSHLKSMGKKYFHYLTPHIYWKGYATIFYKKI